jgi:hypothetical protein
MRFRFVTLASGLAALWLPLGVGVTPARAQSEGGDASPPRDETGAYDSTVPAPDGPVADAEKPTPPPPMVYYAEPTPEPAAIFDANAIWYYGPHRAPGGLWCGIWGGHIHDYAPEWGQPFSFVNGYYYFAGDPGPGSPQVFYFGYHPNPWGGWCYHSGEHIHYYAPRQAETFLWVGGRLRYNGPFDVEFNTHRNEYDGFGRRRYGTSYNEHVVYVRAHPPPPGRSPAELMQMQREHEERMRQAARQREEMLHREQIRVNELHAQQIHGQQQHAPVRVMPGGPNPAPKPVAVPVKHPVKPPPGPKPHP